jgi:hypothetical protein
MMISFLCRFPKIDKDKTLSDIKNNNCHKIASYPLKHRIHTYILWYVGCHILILLKGYNFKLAAES